MKFGNGERSTPKVFASRRPTSNIQCRMIERRAQRPRLQFSAPKSETPGETDIQPKANVENQDRAKCRKNEAGGMKSSGCWVRKHVGNRAADNRSDDAAHD